MTNSEPRDGVTILAPWAEQFHAAERRPIAPRLGSLQGAKIGFIYNKFTSIVLIHDTLRDRLARSDITAIARDKGRFGGPLAADMLQELVAGADAVIGGLCNSAPSTAWGAQDCIELERQGIPTVIMATSRYEHLLAETLESEGMPDLKRIILPYPLEGIAGDAVTAIADQALEHVVAGLTTSTAETTIRL